MIQNVDEPRASRTHDRAAVYVILVAMRVWVVDDEVEVREGVAELIERRVAAARVTGQFARGREALRAVRERRVFDLALVDLGLPDMHGEDVIRQLRAHRPLEAIIAFTIRCDEAAVFATLRAGASGYVTKDASDQDIVDAIQSAASGAAPFSREISRTVAQSFWISPHAERATSATEPIAALTPREREVLELVCTGASYREIGAALGITLGTIQTHIKSIYTKLGVANKAEAVRWVMSAPSAAR